jgi:hypothetical protein
VGVREWRSRPELYFLLLRAAIENRVYLDFSTTMKYTHPTPETMRDATDLLFPEDEKGDQQEEE